MCLKQLVTYFTYFFYLTVSHPGPALAYSTHNAYTMVV